MFQGSSLYINQKIASFDLTEESISESQDFHLKLSHTSGTEDIFQVKGKSCGRYNETSDEIIVLSDSSDSFSPPPRKPTSVGCKVNKVYPIGSPESSDNEHERFFQSWKASRNVQGTSTVQQSPKINNIRQKNSWYTSDENASNSSENNKKYFSNDSSTSSNTHVSLSQDVRNATDNLTKRFPKLGKDHFRDLTSSSNSSNANTPVKILSQAVSETANSVTRKLTKQNTYNILKVLKSTSVYASPKPPGDNHVIVDESSDDNLHPAISPTNRLKTVVTIINETPPDELPDDTSLFTKPVPNQISLDKKLLDEQNVDKGHIGLSSRKKKLIAEWLMKSGSDSKSDSSASHIPASNRNSTSSGNSSLERLELNYETPNNRGKVIGIQKNIRNRNDQDNVKLTYTLTSTKTDVIARKNIDDNYSDNCSPKTYTINSANCNVPASVGESQRNTVTQKTQADILFENFWQTKRNVKVPISEPRKQNSLKNRAVQTEKKLKSKKKNWIEDSDDANDSDGSLSDIRPKGNSKAKSVRKTKVKNDSFIKDSSESEDESLYYTALTNPRPTKNRVIPKPQTEPKLVARVLSLCDSETDEDIGVNDIRYTAEIGRRKLEYSDDENEVKSSTSEFDPGDHVPPKPVVKKDTKTSRRKPLTNNKVNHYKENQSFLASLSHTVPIALAHLDAKKYRQNYKDNKEELCKHLFKLYNEKVFDNKLPADMPIEWNVRMRGTAGYCYNKKSVKALGGVVKSSRIVLATKILDTPDRLRDTLIHEMCHAAAWLINDVSDGHGPFWTGWANRAMSVFPELPQIRRCHDYDIKTKFTYRCTNCGYSIGRHSKSLDVEKKRCGHCYGKFELLTNKTTKAGTVQVQTPKREPSAFALFVKQNYGSVKKERNLKHGEVMKLLGQQFSAIKIAKQSDNKENCLDTPS